MEDKVFEAYNDKTKSLKEKLEEAKTEIREKDIKIKLGARNEDDLRGHNQTMQQMNTSLTGTILQTSYQTTMQHLPFD